MKNVAIGLLVAVLLFVYLGFFRNALIDDAFITLNYVKTLTSTGTWGYFPGHLTNTATSPLNVLLLSLVTLVTRSPLEAVFWLTVGEWLVALYFLIGIGRAVALRWFPILAFPALVLNPLLSSTLGLESILFTTLLITTLYFLLAKRFLVLGVAAALLTLTRPDGILLFAVVLLFLPNWRTRFTTMGIYAIALAPWYLYSWIALGSFLPDTFLIKIKQSWGPISFGDGLRLYFRRYPLEIILTFFFAPFVMLIFAKPVRRIGPLLWMILAYGALHFAAYALLRVPPYHWYYIPEVVCLVLLGTLAISKLQTVAPSGWRRAATYVLVGTALLVPFVGTSYLLIRDGVALRESFIHTNWASHEQYRTVGIYLEEHYAGKTISDNGEPGTIAYYCDCFVLDYLFNVRDWLAGDIARHRQGVAPLDLLYRVNYLFFQPPVPYPAAAADLQVFTTATNPPDPNQPHWFTSTRWIKAGLILMHP